ncbi:MAG: hypothetical protein IPI81_15690 [Flavobacteriales bacterium]|nr:hypothetical protein [Flavobacteriales bacterium]MCC6936590.1 hypothetical protein [Flavobacteriales bacterium]
MKPKANGLLPGNGNFTPLRNNAVGYLLGLVGQEATSRFRLKYTERSV